MAATASVVVDAVATEDARHEPEIQDETIEIVPQRVSHQCGVGISVVAGSGGAECLRAAECCGGKRA